MAEIPAMLLWTDAYMADTSHLTTIEHGAYLLVLMAMWRAGGQLPDDEIRLARTARLSLDKWRRIAPTIRSFLTAADGFVSPRFQHTGRKDRRNLSQAERDAVYERDGFICAYCGTEEPPFEVDHVFPVAKGGTNDMGNLCVACASCNRSKGAAPLQEWLQ